ncbi:CocE/NonD family hydrolase [Gordonia pseudamarae]|jgi:putative CocE/NonD family hydrolase|uniref:CocE/NonD family hydrolase n=1 Tax=Gordonia pseudamarae TaxID=2831662 RepID=A0ABX6IL85_9ACTN|nr:CocE/NonD family hydrolase [Gordonia sp. (in: high G+C Gram-positive bacteria)]QHN27767.1 CocE/NonD family hydrolase [Gordonia pseudamarae]QHN36648.1 CocE/NonD family hydrolase [Gordonia pseudamarae]
MGLGLRRVGVILLAVLSVVAALCVAVPRADAAPLGLHPAQWTKTAQSERQKYPRVAVSTSVPIHMSDGTVLRADVYRPADSSGRAVDTKTPVIVNMTPYNKLISMIAGAAANYPELSKQAFDLLASVNLSGTGISGTERLLKVAAGGVPSIFSVDEKLVRSGYTQIVAEVRGTGGGSQGVWDVFGSREQRDTIEVLDWARTRSYSNGKLGMSGYSYSAINQIQAAAKRPKGLGAIFPAAPMSDIVADVVAPGSGFGAGFLGLWLFAVNATKFIPDLPRLLRGQFDPKWLADRIANPAVFIPEYIEGLTAPSVDELTGRTRDLVSMKSAYRKALTTDAANITTPAFVIGGWQDLFTNMEWRALNQLSGLPDDKKKLVMSTGQHVTNGWDMGRKGTPPSITSLQRAWFDKWLKGVDNGIDKYSQATSHQQGGGWVQSATMPRTDQTHRRLYLNAAHSGTAPTALKDGSLRSSGGTKAAKWTVSAGVTTLCSGDSNRAFVGLISPIDGCANDNRVSERNGLTFTSAPVKQATSINGAVNVHVRTQVDARDGFYVAVLTDVAPDGRSTILTTGNMTVSIRNQMVPAQSTYAPNGDVVDPYYALDAFTRATVKPGSVQNLDIGLLGTDALLKRGHRLRVTLYAYNAPQSVSFGPITNDSGLKPQHILLDPKNPSWVQVPSNRPIG